MSKSPCKTSVRPVTCTPACPVYETCPDRLRKEAVANALMDDFGNRDSAFDWRTQSKSISME